jgi:hypothetical protein
MQMPVFITGLSMDELQTLMEQSVRKVLSELHQSQPNAPSPDELLTRREAAKEFKVSLATLDNYRRDGRIFTRRIGGSVRYKRGDLQAAFSNSNIKPYKPRTRQHS